MKPSKKPCHPLPRKRPSAKPSRNVPKRAKQAAARFGRFAEDIAAFHYEQLGYSVVTRNYRCRKGEIDLLLQRGEELLCVEVRGRRGRLDCFEVTASVTPKKQRRVMYALQHFLCHQSEEWADISLEVMAVVAENNSEIHTLRTPMAAS